MNKKAIRKDFFGINDIDRETSSMSIAYSDEDILVIDSAKEMEDSLPLRLGMNVIAICLKGKIQIDINGKQTTLGERQLILLPPSTTIENAMTSPDYDCRFLCLTNRIVNDFLRTYINVWNETMYANTMKIRQLSQPDMDNINLFYTLLKTTLRQTVPSRYSKEIIRSLLKAAILGLCSSLEEATTDAIAASHPKYSETLFRQFLDMLNQGGEQRHNVSYYADRLCVTPKYLSAVCAKTSGKSAKQWINEIIAENARYYLKSTDLTVKEIADRLGFPSTSYFGRYVKKTFGLAPLALRSGKEM